jgi:hypothetical protein
MTSCRRNTERLHRAAGSVSLVGQRAGDAAAKKVAAIAVATKIVRIISLGARLRVQVFAGRSRGRWGWRVVQGGRVPRECWVHGWRVHGI